jgi:hypothetical protein
MFFGQDFSCYGCVPAVMSEMKEHPKNPVSVARERREKFLKVEITTEGKWTGIEGASV